MAFSISRCIYRLLAVFGAALSGAWLWTRTRWTRKNVSSFAIVCSRLGIRHRQDGDPRASRRSRARFEHLRRHELHHRGDALRVEDEVDSAVPDVTGGISWVGDR